MENPRPRRPEAARRGGWSERSHAHPRGAAGHAGVHHEPHVLPGRRRRGDHGLVNPHVQLRHPAHGELHHALVHPDSRVTACLPSSPQLSRQLLLLTPQLSQESNKPMALVRQRHQLPHLTLPLDHFALRLPPQPQPTAAPSTSTSTSDARLSGYERLSVLRHGNGGTVYKARHRRSALCTPQRRARPRYSCSPRTRLTSCASTR
ncbi:unnamed protein product [Miscanthus lutarioriparius]|uniref:Uncharacterized protein n=1 Tax=Miscanthus lutarioriparius TaxID=422564 RepID=A0A811MWJ5_9POAL|nr:unnamed protein product [Miscanthus lutarioriparius]